MLTELVTVRTEDGVDLDGAWYRAAGASPPRARILIIHGLTWNFYQGPSRWLPDYLAPAEFDCLALNMRDHDLAEPKDFELSHHDIAAGLAWLRRRGDARVVALAHGYGCNKLACYPVLSEDRTLRHSILTTLGGVKRYRPDLWDRVLGCARGLEGDVLVVQGADDPNIRVAERAEELRTAAAGARVRVATVDAGDHYFNGRHAELARTVLAWLTEVL